jgi:hypothetical protein
MIYARTITGETVHADHASGQHQTGVPDGRQYVGLTIDTPDHPRRGVLFDIHNADELLASLENAIAKARAARIDAK